MDSGEADMRIKAASKVVMLLTEALDQNGNVYHGGLVPNLTSISDCLNAPFDVVFRAIPEIDERFDAMMDRYRQRPVAVPN